MYAVLYSWLAAAAVSPFVAILSCWTLVIFRSYRSEWRLLDIFLFALTTLEGVSALFSFGYSVLGVIRPALDAPCRFLVWGLTATRTFHLSTLASLLLDRALLSTKCSKAYRASVHHSQVRYHIVVLAIISVFVGVTSVFARAPAPLGSCTLHPLDWDLKFSAFLACVYGLLLLIGLACCLVVQSNRLQSRGTYRTSLSSSGRNSCGDDRDLEWTVTVSICLLPYVINHVPFLVLNSFGMSHPDFWSPWMDNGVVWLQLVQGILVPCVLLMADLPHRSDLRNILRQPGRIYRHLSDGFHMGDSGNLKPAFPPFPIYRGSAFPQRLRWSPTNLPSLQSLHPLEIDSLHKSYGSGGYTTLLSLPSSTTSFPSPYSSCQSFSSVTTNAVDDFVFRRPSVLALFDPQPPKDESFRIRRYEDGGRRCDTPTPFIDEDMCRCESSEITAESPRDIINKNMINIILAYENGQKSSALEDMTSEALESSQGQGESLGDMSSLTSSESSDADSVQSVIIRQRVDQRGRVSENDITIAQRKITRCNKEIESNDSSSEQRIIYSEYL